MENFETLRQLLDEKKYTAFMRELDKLYPRDAAEFPAGLPLPQQPAVFRMLKKDTAAEIFAERQRQQRRIISCAYRRRASDNRGAFLPTMWSICLIAGQMW